jgi:LacI family transcriptional regulator
MADMAKPRAIGLAVDTIGSFGREVIHGVMEFCHRNPHWVIAMEPRFWAYEEMPEPDKWSVDGLIIQAYRPELFEKIRAMGKPAMNVSNFCRGDFGVPTVVPDDPSIGEMAAEYLLSLGMAHFGYCTNGRFEYGRLRGEAFKKRLAVEGAICHECDTASTEIGPWLDSLPKPVAVFCCNDAWAHRLLSAARKYGIRIPEQVAVLGVDDDELLNTVGACPLSSIAIPAAKVGFEAARLLEAALDGIAAPLLTTLPPLCVVPRTTTDVACVDDAYVAKGLQFIKANAARAIQVDDVVEHLSISRRSLERRFLRTIGHSVGSEIRRAHVERAKQLLIATTLSIEEVATASGFTSATLLGVVFRKYVGEAPTGFRRQIGFGMPKTSNGIPTEKRPVSRH